MVAVAVVAMVPMQSIAIAAEVGSPSVDSVNNVLSERSVIAQRCARQGMGQREVAATVAGAGLGALAGRLIGKGKAGGILGGAAIGGFLGNRAGREWDRQACEKSQRAIATALSTGTTQSWASADGSQGFSYLVDRRYTRSIDTNIQTLDGRTIDMTGLVPSGGVYAITKLANVRATPSATRGARAPFETLQPGRKVVGLGQDASGDWVLVSSTGKAAEGWVSKSALSITGDDQQAFVTAHNDTRPMRVTRVAQSQQCMDTREQVTDAKKSVTSDRSTVCQDRAGNWAASQA